MAPGDDPGRWLASTDFLDLRDAKVSLRARALTQLVSTEREKALALYRFVKGMPFETGFKVSLLRAPREVLVAGRGDAIDKLGVLVALLRSAGIPARIRAMTLGPDVLRGHRIASRTGISLRVVLEAHVGGRWQLTDTYMYDAGYVAAARERLVREGWSRGFGLVAGGETLWDAAGDAFLVGQPYARGHLLPPRVALFRDPAEFIASAVFRRHYSNLAKTMRWNAMVPGTRRAIRELREESAAGTRPEPLPRSER